MIVDFFKKKKTNTAKISVQAAQVTKIRSEINLILQKYSNIRAGSDFSHFFVVTKLNTKLFNTD